MLLLLFIRISAPPINALCGVQDSTSSTCGRFRHTLTHSPHLHLQLTVTQWRVQSVSLSA